MSPEPASAPDLAWGRVDDDGTVSVREVSAVDGTDSWRVVGQYPDGTPDEALAYFARKFSDLADKVRLLEQRQRGGGASASDLTTAAKHLRAEIDGASAVGNLANLMGRVDAILETLSAATATEAAAAKEAVNAAVVERTELVVKAEALAARDPKSVQWKQATQELNDLFESWQAHQQNGPRLPKRESQELWKRFRDARATVEKHRREFFAEQVQGRGRRAVRHARRERSRGGRRVRAQDRGQAGPARRGRGSCRRARPDGRAFAPGLDSAPLGRDRARIAA